MAEKLVRTRFKPQHRTFIREWREHRGHTLEELADLVGCTAGAISNVERMASGYTQGMLEALADALATSAADLISRHPDDSPQIEAVLSRATPEQRKFIMDMAVRLVEQKNGTDG